MKNFIFTATRIAILVPLFSVISSYAQAQKEFFHCVKYDDYPVYEFNSGTGQLHQRMFERNGNARVGSFGTSTLVSDGLKSSEEARHYSKRLCCGEGFLSAKCNWLFEKRNPQTQLPAIE